MPERPYPYYDFTLSLCPHCPRRMEAKIVFEDGVVYMPRPAAGAHRHRRGVLQKRP